MEATAGALPVRPLPDGSDIRKVDERSAERVIEALARAFYDDPTFVWAFPDDDRRLRRIERGFDLWMKHLWLPPGECYTTDRLIGGALWIPPGQAQVDFLTRMRLLPGMIARLRRDLPRLLGWMNRIEKKHPREPHWYLPILGVEPEWQGRGFGAALLRPILERCDSERVPAYLEASTPRNRALYERLGWQVTEEIAVGKGGPPMWLMWREPQR